ncbi:MAG TPA: hypothetical protein VMT53_00080 [Terriglobales bacterium]|nr:hypothetical protein [Terriglobales bacterium]
MRNLLLVFLGLTCTLSVIAFGDEQVLPAAASACRIQQTDYKGWHAQEISNQWVQLFVVPQNGGRLMQVIFDGHSYLFVNPKLAGKYLPPNSEQWFNYGGDKIWLLPEGNNDERHWRGNSDILDDGPFSFRILSQGQNCAIELTGPGDPQTGVQFIRTISIGADSPRIQFHTLMKNVTGHAIEWSMQSVSQYDTADPASLSRRNSDFWAFTPVNPHSSYLNRYHVRFGPAENPAASVRDDGLFALHYAHMATEFWLDSSAGWLAVMDASTHYGMLERFHFDETQPYPGKASVIFWTNGPETHLNADGEPVLSAGDEGQPPYYQEAELNSPLCHLSPGDACSFDTEWFPTRAGNEFHGTTEAGILIQPLRATRLQNGKINLSASFGVFFAGRLIANLYNGHGGSLGTVTLVDVNPGKPVVLHSEIVPPGTPARVALHLQDANGLDRGALGEVPITAGDNR